jgi:5-methylcytosine-specific restriction protein A
MKELNIERLRKNIEKDTLRKRRKVIQQYSKKGRLIDNTTYCRLKSQTVCKICGSKSTSNKPLEVDHIIPIVRGGTNDKENLQAVCRSCHIRKTAEEEGSANSI